jgi:POT family proton-dependent oligopeptide transporter
MKSNKSYPSKAININGGFGIGMPPGIPYIIGNELTETFSAYGMRSIMVVFMTNYLFDHIGNHAFTDPQAIVWYHNYSAISRFLTIIAAVIADVFLGKYKTIIVSSVIYCLGHLTLALFNTKAGLACAFALLAIGNSGIAPCVLAHLGDQFNKKNYQLIDKAYSWFYLTINFGSFSGILLMPYLLEKYGPHIAFSIPAILMFIATIIFYKGRNVFIAIPPISWQKYCKELKDKDTLKALGNLVVVFTFSIVFYALYDQSGSSWVIQAEKMNRNINLGFIHITPYPSQLRIINPILILILVPLFSYKIYPFFDKFTKVTYIKNSGASSRVLEQVTKTGIIA